MIAPAFSDIGFYLALDTSGPVGHVAVGRGPRVLARRRLEQKGRHASELLPAVNDALAEASVDLPELRGVVVGEGPGSFTGVRIAAATAKGIARALDVPLWAVSSLAAAALGEGDHGVRYVLFDARGDRVYAGCYSVGAAGIETLVAPYATELRELLGSDVPLGAAFAGDGAARHRYAIEAAGFEVLDEPAGEPSGDALLRFLSLHRELEPVTALETWEPHYVKASSAERTWTA